MDSLNLWPSSQVRTENRKNLPVRWVGDAVVVSSGGTGRQYEKAAVSVVAGLEATVGGRLLSAKFPRLSK